MGSVSAVIDDAANTEAIHHHQINIAMDEEYKRFVEKKPKVIFVLGGGGEGKTTQCADISKLMGYTHLSSGNILRQEVKKGTQEGIEIEKMMNQGKSVTSEIMNELLLKAMFASGNDKFLLDGFPRSDENRQAFEAQTKIEPQLVIFFVCSEEERMRRIMSRNQGRADDNVETIQKKFKEFRETTMPVINYYESRGIVRRIDAEKSIGEVFEQMKGVLMPQVEGPKTDLLDSIFFRRNNCCVIL